MQNDVSKFVANIVPLQNVQANASGLDSTSVLSNSITAIQQMIKTDSKTVLANTIASYTSNSVITFKSPINFCNVASPQITNNSASLLSAAASGTSTLSSITISVGGNLQVSSLTVDGSGTFGGICYAQQFVTLSDMNAKQGVREWRSPVLSSLSNIHPYIFSYTQGQAADNSQAIGLLAQEVQAIYPQCVRGIKSTSYVNYDGMVAILLKAVQELGARVSSLEGR
jgi:hypothetical protein